MPERGKFEGHFICKECKEVGGHHAKGLCFKCYNKLRRRKNGRK